MKRSERGLWIAILVVSMAAPVRSADQAAAPQAFAAASVNFETNATDGDFEIVISATAGAEGLDKLTVTAPDGRAVLDLASPPPVTLGLRSFRFESPEPKDAAAVRKAFPAGTYTFVGRTASGKELSGKATLSHTLPPAVTLVHPEPEAEDVPAGALQIRWKGVAGVAAYTLEVEQEESGALITATLPPSATTFDVAAGFLAPGREYVLAVGARAADGNLSVLETSFTTAKAAAHK